MIKQKRYVNPIVDFLLRVLVALRFYWLADKLGTWALGRGAARPEISYDPEDSRELRTCRGVVLAGKTLSHEFYHQRLFKLRGVEVLKGASLFLGQLRVSEEEQLVLSGRLLPITLAQNLLVPTANVGSRIVLDLVNLSNKDVEYELLLVGEETT